jgi:glutamine amidotransferase
MELLATTSDELGMHQGLGWIPGHVSRIPVSDPTIRVPHIGWNDVAASRADGMYRDVVLPAAFYFVHSYVLTPRDPAVVNATCTYGVEFAASIEQGHVWATQYHPEKSQRAGFGVLRNFLSLVGGRTFSRSA